MNTVVHVAVPVVRAKTHLEIQKGRPWSIIEHLILESTAREPRALDTLVSGFRLPRALVTSALMRLMRAEWIELRVVRSGPATFAATVSGRVAAMRQELPYKSIVTKTVRFHLYERISGHVFRLDELSHFSPTARPRLGTNEIVTEVTDRILPEGFYRIDEVEDVLLDDDEIAVGIQPGIEYQSERLALFTVVNDAVTNLPIGREVPELETHILRAARQALANQRKGGQQQPSAGSSEWEPERTNALRFFDIHFEPSDLIIGAGPHRDAVENALKSARSRVIIHSTFLGKDSINLFLGLMKEAVSERDVTVDVLWGQKDDEGAEGDAKEIARPPPKSWPT